MISGKKDIPRRKILRATGSVGTAVIGVSGVAAGQSNSNNGKKKGLTKEKVERALSNTEVPVTDPRSKSGVEIESSGVPDDVKIYIGKNQNAKPPHGRPFAIESYEEYLQREAPPGFEKPNPQISPLSLDSAASGPTLLGTSDEVNIQPADFGTDFFYLKEDVGSVTLEGYTFNVGIGAGVKIEGTSALDLEATLSVDLYIDGVSFSLTSFTVGYGVTDKGLCLGPFNVNYSVLRGLDVELCGKAGLTEVSGDQLEVTFGPTLSLCVDPCPGFTCAYCKEISASFSKTFDNPL